MHEVSDWEVSDWGGKKKTREKESSHGGEKTKNSKKINTGCEFRTRDLIGIL
jgi:hypothetical protein